MKYFLFLFVSLIPAIVSAQIHSVVNEVNSTYNGNQTYTMGAHINVCQTPTPIVNPSIKRVAWKAKVIGPGAALCGTRKQMPTQTSGYRLDQSGVEFGREGIEEWLCVSPDASCVDINVIEFRYQYPGS